MSVCMCVCVECVCVCVGAHGTQRVYQIPWSCSYRRFFYESPDLGVEHEHRSFARVVRALNQSHLSTPEDNLLTDLTDFVT